MSHIVILSLNIWNYNEPWVRRRGLIVDLVRTASPNLVGFQEIRHDGNRDVDGKNQAEQLAELLPDHQYIYRPAQRDPERDQWEGLAIFSRHPFRSSSFTVLTRNPSDNKDNHQRVVLHGAFEIGGQPFHLFDTHLSLSKEGRIRTTQEITAFTDRYEGPKVLVGDFNEVSHEEPIRHIVEQASFSDSWERLHPDEPGLTYSDANTYVDNEPDNGGRRIDYVFARDGAKVERCEIVGNVPDSEGHFPADHFGLIAEVCVENSR